MLAMVQVLPGHCGCDRIVDFLRGGSEPLPDHRCDSQAEHMAGSSIHHRHDLMDPVFGALPWVVVVQRACGYYRLRANVCVRMVLDWICSGSARACRYYIMCGNIDVCATNAAMAIFSTP